MKIDTFQGNQFIDDRGCLKFFNEFTEWSKIKRMYTVDNRKVDSIRAWHGHKLETKYIFVPTGAIMVKMFDVQVDEYRSLYHNDVKTFILDSRNPQILKMKPENDNILYHGFKILEPNTTIQFFSSLSLEEAKIDDYRLEFNCQHIIDPAGMWKEVYR